MPHRETDSRKLRRQRADPTPAPPTATCPASAPRDTRPRAGIGAYGGPSRRALWARQEEAQPQRELSAEAGTAPAAPRPPSGRARRARARPVRVEGLCRRIGSTGLRPYAAAHDVRRTFAARQVRRASGYPEHAATGIGGCADLRAGETAPAAFRQAQQRSRKCSAVRRWRLGSFPSIRASSLCGQHVGGGGMEGEDHEEVLS